MELELVEFSVETEAEREREEQKERVERTIQGAVGKES